MHSSWIFKTLETLLLISTAFYRYYSDSWFKNQKMHCISNENAKWVINKRSSEPVLSYVKLNEFQVTKLFASYIKWWNYEEIDSWCVAITIEMKWYK